MKYRVETVHGRHLLCGGPIPASMVAVDQRWAPASGGNYEVVVRKVKNDWVTYGAWKVGGPWYTNTKSNFGFQCRYCLVLDTPEVPEQLRSKP